MHIREAGKYRRNEALDFTKGALVLVMVLYHWLNYFVSTEGGFYVYLRFLTPSFIFITGFLISQVYLVANRSDDLRVPTRLMQRGLKILAVFMVLNVARTFVIPDARSNLMPSQSSLTGDLISIFITGNVSGGENSRAAAFHILVPISYLLLFSALLMILCKGYRYTFHTVCLCSILWVAFLRLNGLEYGNLDLVTIGLLGVVVGHIPIERIDTLVKHSYFLAAAYVSYVAAITIWSPIYPLQVFGVCLSLIIIYRIGNESDQQGGRAREQIILLGRYSLFGYIVQIAILQGLYRTLRPAGVGVTGLAISFIAAFVLTILAVVVLEHARTKLTAVDKVYRAVFT